ncbi:MAG: metallophosphoesterase family protein [Alphaproteobacteria bacterium]
MILKRFLGQTAKATSKKNILTPPQTVIYAVGDIHGRADLLEKLLCHIHEHRQNRPNHHAFLVFIGDYVDRGMESKDVIDLLLESIPPNIEPIFLKGNHEAMLLQFMHEANPDYAAAWLANHSGGLATLYSYGVGIDMASAQSEDYWRDRSAFLQEKMPANHLAFFQKLKTMHQMGDYLFVHAGIRPGLPLTQQTENDLLWIREPFLSDSRDHGLMVVHGHTIGEKPLLLNNRIAIDTGAFATGRLTCLVLEGESRQFIAA